MRTAFIRAYVVASRARFARVLAATLALLALAFVAPSAAQTPTGRRAALSTPVGSQERPTFWLADENGAWRIPLPNWSLEDVMRIVDAKREPFELSPFSIENVDASGEVVDDLARLTIRISVNVADGYARVPLGLREGVFIPSEEEDETSWFSCSGPGLCALDVDPETGDYSAAFYTPEKSTKSAPSSAPKIEASAATPNVPTEEEPSPKTIDETANMEGVDAEETSAAEGNEDGSSAEEASATEASATETSATEASATESSDDSAVEEPSSSSAPRDLGGDRASQRLRPNRYLLTLQLCFACETAPSDDDPTLDAETSPRRLVASFPSSLHSQLTLIAPSADVEIVSVKGASADAPTPMSESTSELKLRGLGRGGETVEATWRKARRTLENDEQENAAALQVEDASITVELSARDATYEAILPIRVFGGEVDAFRVELPPGSPLTIDSASATGANDETLAVLSAELEADSSEHEGAAEADPRVLAVKLAQPTASATLKIKTHPRALTEKEIDAKRSARVISGFNVLGARKQFGQVKVVKSQDAYFNVSSVYGASAAGDGVQEESEEIFSFFSQPFLLTVEGYERDTIVNAKPEYFAQIGLDGCKMRARFDYSAYGAKIKDLKFRLNGWNLSGYVDAKNVVERVELSEPDGETLLSLRAPTDGDFAIELELERDGVIESTEERVPLSFPLPLPIATRVEQGALVVAPENAVELTPNPDASVALVEKTARSFALSLEFPKESRQTPFYYQTRAFSGAESNADPTVPVFAADARRLTQEIEIAVKTDASISEKGLLHVSQTFDFNVEHVPLEKLAFRALKRGVDASNRLVKCFVDGKARDLVFEPYVADDAVDPNAPIEELERARDPRSAPGEYVLCRVALDAPKIGACVLAFHYDLGVVEFQPEASTHFNVDLFEPVFPNANEAPVSNELRLSAPRGVALAHNPNYQSIARGDAEERAPTAGSESFWRVVDSTLSDNGKTETIVCKSYMSEPTARFVGSLNTETTVVERAWMQSWFSDSMRVDRVAYRARCKRDRLEIKLPDDALVDRVAVAINGREIPIANDPKNGFTIEDRIARIPVSDELRAAPFALELSYVAPSRSVSTGKRSATFPAFIGESVWIRRAYWQIILAGNRHVTIDPKNWTAEFVVRRRGLFSAFQRIPTMTQDELAEWVGVEKREPLPEEANAYLYSAFGATEDVGFLENGGATSFFVADRALLALVGAGLTLALGFALLYAPAFRRRGALFTTSTFAIALLSIRPLLSLLFLQTVALGAALAFLAAALAKYWGRSKTPTIAALNDLKKRGQESAPSPE